MLARMTTTEAKWTERVREWRASGKSAEAFADGREFEPTTLRYWASRLKLPASTTTPDVARAAPKASVAMARVVRRRNRSVATSSTVGRAELAIAIGAARITVGRGFDAELLRSVVAALGGGR
jgi:hypothetical protein